MTRLLLKTDKAQGLVRSIHDSRQLIEQVESEDAGLRSKSDREMLARTYEELARAKSELAALFDPGNSEKRTNVLKQHRESKLEKTIRGATTEYRTPATRPNTSEGGLLSEATRRKMERKHQESTRPVTAPALDAGRVGRGGSDVSTSGGEEHSSPPRHTGFLKRRSGSTASGKQSAATGGVTPPALVTVSSPRRRKKVDGDTKIPGPSR